MVGVFYRAPNPGTSINITRYVSNGYVVLLPDIVYDTGYPGEGALNAVREEQTRRELALRAEQPE
jgi:hypothetical protein